MRTIAKVPVETQFPKELVAEARVFVNDGWAANLDELLADSLRRYLDSHAPALSEELIRQDVDWGLHGSD